MQLYESIEQNNEYYCKKLIILEMVIYEQICKKLSHHDLLRELSINGHARFE